MVGITIKLSEEEHKILKEKASKARQSINQYILSKTIDEEKEKDKLLEEINYIKQKLESKNVSPPAGI